MLKKVLTFISILIGVVIIACFIYLNVKKSDRGVSPITKVSIKNNSTLYNTSKEKLYNDILVSFLFTYTQKAVDDFYSKYLKEIPGADPNLDKVLSVERTGSENCLDFLIKIETMPYIGPHNSVGRDHITFRLDAIGNVKFENFRHIESSKILPQLYPDIIKNWPPPTNEEIR